MATLIYYGTKIEGGKMLGAVFSMVMLREQGKCTKRGEKCDRRGANGIMGFGGTQMRTGSRRHWDPHDESRAIISLQSHQLTSITLSGKEIKAFHYRPTTMANII